MEKWSELGAELDTMLKSRTPSLGVKLLKNIDDIPEEIDSMGFTCSVCQAAGTARYYNKQVAITKEDAWACCVGGRSLGFYDIEEDILNGERNPGFWGEDAKACARLCEGDAIDVGTFSAAIFSPLSLLTMEPDIVLAYGTPDQMLSLVYGNIWHGKDRVKLLTSGHGGCCRECIAAPYLNKELRLAITDIGERKFAGAYDNEMEAGVPYDKFEELVKGLRGAHSGIYKLPIAPWGIRPWAEMALYRTGLKDRIKNKR